MSLEKARRDVQSMMALEKWAKAHVPKGKEYVGIKFKTFNEAVNGRWRMGVRCIPVFKKKAKRRTG